jgi:hypothetical protein
MGRAVSEPGFLWMLSRQSPPGVEAGPPAPGAAPVAWHAIRNDVPELEKALNLLAFFISAHFR